MGEPVLQPAPGAHIARTLGILSVIAAFAAVVFLVLSLSIVSWWLSLSGFAVVPVLATVGILKHMSAKRTVKRTPGLYTKPDNLGFRLCIWGLVFDAIFSAIFVPAIWVDVVAGRDRYTLDAAVKAPMTSLAQAYPGLARSKASHQEVLKGLESILCQVNAQGPNVWDHAHTLVDSQIEEVQQQAPESVEAVARGEAKRLGQGVFVLTFPANGHPGYLAAAARLKKSRFATGGMDSEIASQVVELSAVE